MLATVTKPKTKSKTPAQGKAAEEPTTLAEIGRLAAKEAQRKALLAVLKRLDWNLTATAEALGLSNPSNVIRAVRALGLEEEYDEAKTSGLIPKGPRVG